MAWQGWNSKPSSIDLDPNVENYQSPELQGWREGLMDVAGSIYGRNTAQMDASQMDASMMNTDRYDARKAALENMYWQGMGEQNQWRGDQQYLMGALKNRVEGGTPSIAEMQMRQGLQEALAAQQGLVGASTGANRALSQRTAAMNTAGLQQNTSAQAAMLRAQEQQAAEAALGNLASGARAQDMSAWGQGYGIQQGLAQNEMGVAGSNQQAYMTANQANLQAMTQAGTANLQAQIDQERNRDAMYAALTGQGIDISKTLYGGQQQYEAQRGQNYGQALGALSSIRAAKAGKAEQRPWWQDAAIGAIGGAATGGAMKLSDKSTKKNIKEISKDLEDLMDNLQAYEFVYKNDSTEEKHCGIMAQDMEKSKLGKEIVKEVNGVKYLVMDKLTTMLTAAVSNLHKRIKVIEASI